MIRKDFPKLGEHYFEQRLANGLLVRVIEKPGFAKRYAFVATDYGSIDAEFILDGKKYTTPQGVAHYLELVKALFAPAYFANSCIAFPSGRSNILCSR